MSTSLDRRAETAAAAVRAAAADLQPPPEAVPPAAPRRWPVLVAALVLVIAAVTGAVVLQRDDGDTVVAGPNDTLHLIPGQVPGGLAPGGASDLPADGGGDRVLDLYGKGPDDDALRDGDVAVLVIGRDSSPDGDNEEVVQVRGVAGQAHEEAGSSGVRWEEPGLGSVALVSHSLGSDELVRLADGLQRQGERLVLDPATGFEHVSDVYGSLETLLYRVIPGARSAVVHYQSEGEVVARTLFVVVTVDEPGLLDSFRWLGGTEARRTTVRGHEGWFLPGSDSDDFSPYLALGWRERPGVLVTISGLGISEDELRAAAESLRPASDQEWHDLVAAATDESGAPSLAAGEGWRYTSDSDGGVCFEVEVGDDASSGACSAPGGLDRPQLYEGASVVEDGTWVHGRVGDDVARVAVRPEGGRRRVVDTIPIEGGGRAWAALVPAGGARVGIVALTADGTQVQRTEVTPDTPWVSG